MESSRRPTKNEKKRLKKKEHKGSAPESKAAVGRASEFQNENQDSVNDQIDVEYVSADLTEVVGGDVALLEQFKSVFEKFSKAEELTAPVVQAGSAVVGASAGDAVLADATNSERQDEVKKLSKKKKKLLSRLSVAELKQLVHRPDVVEAHDVTASDPRLLVYLKAYRNTVPVPRHWCHIRKYLMGKRGIEKPPFQLPEFIAETGIAKIRDTVIEQEAMKKSKQKARDKLQVKTGKIDIDYQVLHDAFFKYQTKPKVTGHGDLYYEGKEFEIHMKEKKPGNLSPELLLALGMAESCPPPWLINMQRYGPPPAYPSMRIPGLSAPIPPGAQFGYQPGGWGKPPVDEYGRPLYGDVFGTVTMEEAGLETVDKTTRWGEVAAYESEEEEEEEEEEEVAAAAGTAGRAGRKSGFDASGTDTPATMDGLSTANTGLETPDTVFDLRKRSAGADTPDSVFGAPGQARELYQVIQERHVQGGAAAGQLFASDRGYVLPSKGDVQVAINPDDLGDKDRLQEAYNAHGGHDDDDDDARSKRKRRMDASNASKRFKDFKF